MTGGGEERLAECYRLLSGVAVIVDSHDGQLLQQARELQSASCSQRQD